MIGTAPNEKSICVFTSIIGGYELLNEQPDFIRRSADFLCFTDKDIGQSDTWNIITVKPDFPHDAVRSQRSIKLLEHPNVKKYDYSIYIDNSVILAADPTYIVDQCLGDQYDIALCKHSFRERVLDEFQAVSDLAYDEQAVILKQLEAYAAHYQEVLGERPHWGGIIVRRQGVETVETMMRIWFNEILLHSRRDQLSFNVAAKKTRPRLNSMEINNNSSPFHSWPHVQGRRRGITLSHMAREIADATAVANLIKEIKNSGSSNTSRFAPDEELLKLPCATLTLQAGSNYAGAGGEVSFGIAEFPDYSPMASIGGSLENATAGESQGGISFKTRPIGPAGKDMEERVRINANGTLSLLPVREPSAGIGCTLYFDEQKGLLVSFDGISWRRIETSDLREQDIDVAATVLDMEAETSSSEELDQVSNYTDHNPANL